MRITAVARDELVVRPELLDETWDAVLRGWTDRKTELAQGKLFAEGVADSAHEPIEQAILAQGQLTLPPPCRYCALDLLCGRSGGRG